MQGQTFERNEDALLYQRYIKMKQDRDLDKSKEPTNRISLEDAVDIVGICDMMCPEFESLQRYFERDLDPFERSPTGAYDRSLMVQQFARAAAGNDLPPPEDIRPPPVLRVTVEYLLDRILVQHGIEATHNFIWNRTRAVRSDLTRQRDHSPDAIYCLERIVRYHILAHHLVCRGQREVETLEIEQLKKALQSLMEVYQDARSQYSSPHEAEFRSYYILMHIRSKHAPFTLRHLPSSVYNSPVLQWALRIRFSILRNTDGADEHNSDVTQTDYAGFFDLLSQPHTSYLTACLLESHFDDIRRQLCLMLGLTFKNTSRFMPIHYFQGYLRLDSTDDAKGWVSHLKWNVTPQGMVEIPQTRKLDVLLPPLATATPFPRPKSRLVQLKRQGAFPQQGQEGALDSFITRSEGSTFGLNYVQPPSLPQRRRNRGPPVIPMSHPSIPAVHSQPPSFPAFFAGVSTSKPPSQPTPQPMSAFNPFGRQPQRVISSITTPPGPAMQPAAPTMLPTSAFTISSMPPPTQPHSISPPSIPPQTQSVPRSAFAAPQPLAQPVQTSRFSGSSSLTVRFADTPSLRAPSPAVAIPVPAVVPAPAPALTSTLAPTISTPATSSMPPSMRPEVDVQPRTPAFVAPSVPVQPSPAASAFQTVDTPPLAPTSTISNTLRVVDSHLEQPPSTESHKLRESAKEPPLSSAIGPPQVDSSKSATSRSPWDAVSKQSSSDEPIRREGPRRPLSDGYISAGSSVMPASTRGDEKEVGNEIRRLPDVDEETRGSSDSDAGRVPSTHHLLQSQAQEHNRIVTLRSVVQQWREMSTRNRKRMQLHNAQIERAEKNAQEISLGVRFTPNKFNFARPTPSKQYNKDYDATRVFVVAEEDVRDVHDVWKRMSFARIAAFAAKRRTPTGDLPAGWEVWLSFAPGADESTTWLKTKLAGGKGAPNLCKVVIGRPVTGDQVAAPGILILQLEPGQWDRNLERVQELLSLVPDDSPYLPGLLLVVVASEDQVSFPITWVTKLDRMIRDVVLDRRALVFKDTGSSNALDNELFQHLLELKFDVEGIAPRLPLKDLVFEYMNWWNVVLEYGSEQALKPTIDFDILLLVISVLMSGLDEFLRQICQQCRVAEVAIPFNNFQSKRDLSGACAEMVAYLKRVGGNFRHIPTTPTALMQNPEILFQILSRIANTLKNLVMKQEDHLFPRPGLKQPLLEQLGHSYHSRLETELQSIDRTTTIYSQSPEEPSNLSHTNLKRKRQPSLHTNGAMSGTSLSEEPHTPQSVVLKRSRSTIEQPHRPESPFRISFKVQMAKARLDLKMVQAVDLDKIQNEQAIVTARADTLAKLARPLLDAVVKADAPSDQNVIECRAILELINGARDSVFELLRADDGLVSSVVTLANLTDKPGNLEFRELVAAAYNLAERFESEYIMSFS